MYSEKYRVFAQRVLGDSSQEHTASRRLVIPFSRHCLSSGVEPVMRSICKAVLIVTICLLLFARSPGHPVDEIHLHGGFLGEEDDPVIDVDVCAVAASEQKRDSA